MTTVARTTAQSDPTNYDVHIATWGPMAGGDDGDPIKMPESSDRTIQFDGVFSGGTAALEGSLNKADWFTLTDPQGNLITKAAAALEAIEELTLWVRPKVTGGDVNTQIFARLLIKKAR